MAASSGLILVGVCYMAMPLAIVGGTFGQVWQERDRILISEKSKAKFSAEGFSKDQLAELFHAIDQDGSGSLSRKEFVQLIQTFNLGFTTAQIKKLYRSIDEDGTGSVTFKEFCDFLFPEIEIDDEEQQEPPSPSPSNAGRRPSQDAGGDPQRSPENGRRPSHDGASETNVPASPVSPGKSNTGKEKSSALRTFQKGAVKTKATSGLTSCNAVPYKEEYAQMQVEVRSLEEDIKSLQKEMSNGFKAINALLGIGDQQQLPDLPATDPTPNLPGSINTPTAGAREA
jgi:hypothetical protein